MRLLLRKLDVGPVSQNGKKIMVFKFMALVKTLFECFSLQKHYLSLY
jgi:hypothetical protein